MEMISSCFLPLNCCRWITSSSFCRIQSFIEPRTPGFSSVRISPASSSTRTFKAAEEGGICRISAISLTHRGFSSRSFRIRIRISEESAFPTSISSFSFSKDNCLFMLFSSSFRRISLGPESLIFIFYPLCSRLVNHDKGPPHIPAAAPVFIYIRRFVNLRFSVPFLHRRAGLCQDKLCLLTHLYHPSSKYGHSLNN